MRLRNVAGAVLFGVGVLVLVDRGPQLARADDKPAVAGVWAKKGGEMKVEFADKEVLKLSPHGRDDVILVVCKYTVEKGGLIKAKITDHEGSAKDKVKELLPVGLEFNFQWKATGDTATLSDVKGDNVETLKSHLEGDFEAKK
ncbi:MAG: hypothetical protein ACJ8F7_15325 [Gemmataceae bacterium]